MNDDRLTPLEVTHALGCFDLDVCGSENQKWFHAKQTFVKEKYNGLTEDWHGRVWCNPGFSKPQKWVERMALHQNGTLLCLAQMNCNWIHDWCLSCAKGVLFPRKRMRFYNFNGSIIYQKDKNGNYKLDTNGNRKKSSFSQNVCLFGYSVFDAMMLYKASIDIKSPLYGSFLKC